MRRIRVENPSIEGTYKTFLDSAYSSGTALTVKATTSFAANDLLVIGEPSQELTELKQLSSITAPSTLNLASALNFSHTKETPVYKVVWNFVSIESRSSSAGTFAEITQSGIQWDSKTNETIYFDPNGTNSYNYRFRFYNSITATYSEYSPTLTGSPPARNTLGFMIDNIRKTAGDPLRKIVTDDEIVRFINRAQDIVYARNTRWWFLLVDTYKGSNGIAATAGNNVYTLAGYSTFGHLDSIRYRYTSGSNDILYHLRKLDSIEFDARVRNLNKTADNWAKFYKLLPGDSSSSFGYFQVDPKTKDSGVGTFYPNYYEKMADLDSVEDATQVPIPAILEDYAIGQVFKIKNMEDRATFYENQFYGPADRTTDRKNLTGIALLEELDDQQKKAQAQAVSLVRFRGQKYNSKFFGENISGSIDYIRENYF